ncbi:biotin--[acetyl-CoA-carboxylase] ligase [Chloroflexia bacterium SDU3-3]|nr:biotin--[acetyl-CoA-carboxylase] ligase [Chloroflexia bacterium SDU3-3]
MHYTAAMTTDTPLIGSQIERHAQVGSTNDMVRERARAGAAEGLAIIADEQTKGRGRLGRAWAAPPGGCLLLSALLRPTWLPPADSFLITMLAATALCEAAELAAPQLRARLKWPNDLLLPAAPQPNAPLRKAAGILCELAVERGQIAHVALGIGVNVSWHPQGVVDGRDLGAQATSLGAASGQPVDRERLLAALLTRLDARYAALRRGHRESLFAEWQGRLATLGQQVEVSIPGAGVLRGLAEGVDRNGSLILRGGDGQRHTITAGDVQA